ncbi:MAG: c-type cytochrome [Sphaerospermopsis sp. SIO1G2]|nr:c-type cytochrome [Sphaerospermopsis sp. SIO1G1]NET71057.1 c-type cytochrome [Sphaerospermopsis sp. SIO1G2]
MKKLTILIFLTFCLWVVNFTAPVYALDIQNGAEVFSANCAGCHINGGNIIRRGKNLKKRALKRYKMDSLEAIEDIVTNGKNNMSAYADRLTTAEIENVAAYVLEQAENNWK